MRSTSASNFRKNLASELDKVVEGREPLIVHRNGKKPSVVIIPLAEFKEMDETDYLMSSPENARRLLESIADADAGRFVKSIKLPE